MGVRGIKFDQEVQEGIKNGAHKVYKAVKSTMGAKGRYVGIQTNYHENYVTKDGYYTAQTIYLEDEAENMGAQMIKEVAKKSADDAGDGTTTSTVLAYKLYELASNLINQGSSAIDIKRGITKGVEHAVSIIKDLAVPVEGDMTMIEQVATVSANNNSEIGKLIVEAYKEIKTDGIIHVEEAKSAESTIEATEGMRINSGLISPYFINDPERMRCNLEDTYILLYDGTISTLNEILPVLEFMSTKPKNSLLIVAMHIEQEALSTLVRNKMEGGLKVAAIPAPGVGKTKDTWLKDIEVASGAIIISEKGGQGIKNFNQDNLGSAAKVRATEHTCEIIGGAYDPEEKEARIRTIKNQLDEAKQPQSISFYKDRLSRLDGGVAIIHVGATTEVELKEKKDLFEDAIAATKAAAAEGILPGGGSSLAQISMSVANLRGNNQGEQDGINVLVQAMREPLITIMENAGLDGRQILNTVLSIDEPMLLERIWNYFFNKNKEKANTNFNYGFNLNTNKYCDMVKAGILDTAKVERLALENSSSVASMMLMTDTLIYTKNPE